MGPFWGTLINRCRIILGIRDPKRDHNFDNHPYVNGRTWDPDVCGLRSGRAGWILLAVSRVRCQGLDV